MAMTWLRAAMAAGTAVLCAGLLTGAAAAPAANARTAVREARWGRAEEVPGTARLNTAGNAAVTSLSCWSVNNCAASGYYTNGGGQHPFVVAERNGRWGKARRVPGLAVLNTKGDAAVTSLSCARGGYCVAAGYYTGSGGHSQGFVVTGVNGHWRKATAVPGLAALNTGGNAQVNSVSCPAAGQCAAAGSYTGASGEQGFVASQARGVWGTATEVPGLAALNTSGDASVSSLSCGSAGNCAAGGYYDGEPCGSGGICPGQVFVASEENGVWSTAEEVPGTAALNTGDYALVASVSCARDGYCALGGYTESGVGNEFWIGPFMASGRNGRWHAAVSLGGPGLGDFGATIASVSCPSARACVAAGSTYSSIAYDSDQVSVATQVKGVWGPLDLLPGVRAQGWPNSVSCPSAGNCGVGGAYQPDPYADTSQTFVASETDGRLAKAEQVPGMTALGASGGQVNSVSCPSAGRCTAAGTYQNATSVAYPYGQGQAFVTAP
jgi:hypothetical protein